MASRTQNLARNMVQACAVLAACCSLTPAIGWVFGRWKFAAFGADYIPMAPSTAWLLVLISTALYLHSVRPKGLAGRIAGSLAAGVSGVAGLVVLALPGLPSFLKFEAWLAASHETVGGITVGLMSPHTALTFLGASGAMACLMGSPGISKPFRWLALALGAGVSASGWFALLGYIAGTPLLYGSSFVPMALLTACAFALLGIGFMIAAHPENWLLQGLAGMSARLVDEPSRRIQRALALVFLIFIAGIGITGFFYLRVHLADLRQEAQQELGAIADFKAAQIADWRGERLADAAVISEGFFMRPSMEAFFRRETSAAVRTELVRWLSLLQAQYHFEWAALYDAQKNLLLTVPERDATPGSGLLGNVAAGLENSQIALTDLHRDDAGNVGLDLTIPVFASASPAERRDPRSIIAVLVLHIDASKFLFPLIQSWPTPSRTAETLLVRRDGGDILYLNELRHRAGTALNLRIPLTRIDIPAVQTVVGKEELLEGPDYRGVPVLAVGRRIAESPWYIVAKEDREEIYADVRMRALSGSGFLIMLTIVAILAIRLIWQRRESELLARQVDIERERGTLGERLALLMKNANDIILILDENWRIAEVNDRALEAYGYSLAEFMGLTVSDLAAPREQENFSQTKKRLLDEGQAIYETLHQRKDGSVFPVEISLRPARFGSSRYVLGIGRDITERKRMEEVLAIQTRIANIFATVPDDEMFDKVLKVILELMHSPFGIFGYLDDHGAHVVPTMTRQVWNQCQIPGQMTRFPRETWGDSSWPRAIREKKAICSNEPSTNIPEGHVGIQRHISLPILYQDETIGLFQVANKETDYTEADIGVLRGIADHVGPLLNARVQQDRAKKAQDASELRYRRLFESAKDGILILDAETGTIVDMNPLLVELLAFPREAFLNKKVWELGFFKDLVANQANFEELRQKEYIRYENMPLETGDGRRIEVEFVSNIYQVDSRKVIQCNIRDVTERKRAEKENAKLEAQLRQAHKMESVGRLAGGVAHDFNNMLGVILGYAGMALAHIDPGKPLYKEFTEIRKAAERSADLTRQLLAFARRQTIEPKVLDLNETVKSMLNILRRLIGEDIDLNWKPGAELWRVRLDPSQIDQLLANLCVNARDAISGIGTMTVETRNSTLDQNYCAAHPGCVPGEYVLLAVSDNGCGIDEETQLHIFEPFFTTKDIGRGTGLGLSTVYGVVKQNNGFIDFTSEPGRGTSFMIYLPRHVGEAGHIPKQGSAGPIMRGHETILLVEDQPSLLKATTRVLEIQGYTVLPASTADEATRMAKEHGGDMQLIITDVVMPGMNGRDLAKNLMDLYPHLKLLFMSGYEADVIAGRGKLDEGACFIQKPFSPQDLYAKIRNVLNSE